MEVRITNSTITSTDPVVESDGKLQMNLCGGSALIRGDGGAAGGGLGLAGGEGMSLHVSNSSTSICVAHFTRTKHSSTYPQKCAYTCSDVAARNFSLSTFSLSLIDGRGFRGQALVGEGRGWGLSCGWEVCCVRAVPHSLADVHQVARGLVWSLHKHELQFVH